MSTPAAKRKAADAARNKRLNELLDELSLQLQVRTVCLCVRSRVCDRTHATATAQTVFERDCGCARQAVGYRPKPDKGSILEAAVSYYKHIQGELSSPGPDAGTVDTGRNGVGVHCGTGWARVAPDAAFGGLSYRVLSCRHSIFVL